MSNDDLKRTQTSYLKEIDEIMNKIDESSLEVGKNNLAEKFDIDDNDNNDFNPLNGAIYKNKYKFNFKAFEDNFDFTKGEILTPYQYVFATVKQGNLFLSKTLTDYDIKKDLQNIKMDQMEEINEENSEEEVLEEEEESNESESDDEKLEKKENIIINENPDIFGQELFPPNNEAIGPPPIENVEVSDIDIEEEDELDEDEIIPYQKKTSSIIVYKGSPEENNYQFTEHILNQVKNPIEMITTAEKIYELMSKKVISNEKTDLSPLVTFKKKNMIKVELFKNINMKGQYNQFLQNGKFSLEDYSSNDQKDEIPTVFVVDNQDYKTNCSIIFGTNKGTLIKIPICNKPSPDCQSIIVSSEEKGISSLDIFKNNIIMGHIDGTIQLWESLRLIYKINEAKCEIIQIKFIKINLKKKKYEFIYCDSNGVVNYVKITKSWNKYSNINEEIVSRKEFPFYKICLYIKDKNINKSKKKDLIIALVSLNNVELHKIRPKKEKKILALIEIPSSIIGNFIFDCDFGYGFPPIQKLNIPADNEKEKEKIISSSLIDNQLIEKGKEESLLFIVSYGIIIKLFEINNKKSDFVEIKELGHYIADSPICKLGFNHF